MAGGTTEFCSRWPTREVEPKRVRYVGPSRDQQPAVCVERPQSFVGAMILSCVTFWLCGHPIFGTVGFIMAGGIHETFYVQILMPTGGYFLANRLSI